ncbi:MAG TPA: site-specific integrase, partial [Lysobacter sp.]|nr:site-specific integrase [Lysobacter sp.]
MANFERRSGAWRARVMVDGQRESATFPTKREAAAWASMREAELSGAQLPDKTLAEALMKYKLDVAPTHKGERWEAVRLGKLATYPIARKRLESIAGHDVAAWRDARLKEVAPASVAREMTLLRSVFEACRADWGWLRANPMADVKKPAP